jgi:ABC-type transporter Mla MlaB component
MNRTRDEQMEAEWEAWQKVCRQLRALGAITDKDLSSPVSRLDTPGCALLVHIRAWGEAKSHLDELNKA